MVYQHFEMFASRSFGRFLQIVVLALPALKGIRLEEGRERFEAFSR